MATATELATNVAKLEERVSNHIKFFWVVVAFGFVWLGALTTYIASHTDNGLVLAASRIKSGKPPEEIKKSLSVISAEAALIQAQGKVPNKKTAKDLGTASKAVASAIMKYPQYSETWQAASALVNLRSLNSERDVTIPPSILEKVGPRVPNRGDCFETPTPGGPSRLPTMPPTLNYSTWTLTVVWHDCTLNLDDVEGFSRSTLVEYVREKVGSNTVTIFFDLQLVRVNVNYRGGALIPIRRLISYDGTFSFDIPTSPPKRGQDLLLGILSEGFAVESVDVSVPTA